MNKTQENKTMELIIKQLDKIENKLDKVDSRLDSAEKIAIKQEQNLQEHMRRTDLLEIQQNKLKEEVNPILKAHTVVLGIAKILAAISFCVGLITAISKLF